MFSYYRLVPRNISKKKKFSNKELITCSTLNLPN